MTADKKPRQIRVGTLLTAGLLLFAVGATVSAAIVGATHHAPPSHVYTAPKATASDAPADTPTASPTPAATSQDTRTVTTPAPDSTAPATTSDATSSSPAPSVSSALPTAPLLAPPLQPAPAAQPPAPRCDPGQVAMWKDGAWVCVAVG